MVMKVREEKKRVLKEQLDIIEAEKSRVCATVFYQLGCNTQLLTG